MFKLFHKKNAQSTLEYAVLIVIIIAALIAVQAYIKRGVQGRMKSSADDIGDQFSPGNTNAIKTTKTSANTQELLGMDRTGTYTQGIATSVMTTPEVTNTLESSQIINIDREYWGQ